MFFAKVGWCNCRFSADNDWRGEKFGVLGITDRTSGADGILQSGKYYEAGTFGKYGKINKFVKTSELNEIDKSVFNFMNYIKEKQTDLNPLFKDGTINLDFIKEIASKVNKTNAGFLGLGLLSSIIGLSVIVPKTTLWITKQLTGRNEFTGIANYDDLNKKKDEVKA